MYCCRWLGALPGRAHGIPANTVAQRETLEHWGKAAGTVVMGLQVVTEVLGTLSPRRDSTRSGSNLTPCSWGEEIAQRITMSCSVQPPPHPRPIFLQFSVVIIPSHIPLHKLLHRYY